jgi:hypothetical protein
MATESLLMATIQVDGDRQALNERIRVRAMAKDYEWFPESSESWIRISAIPGMLRRLSPERGRMQPQFKYRQQTAA